MDIDVLLPSGGSIEFFSQPCIALPVDPKGKQAEHPFVAPFWLAQNEGSEGNLELKTKRVQVLDFVVHLPVLVNCSKIEANDFLKIKVVEEEKTEAKEDTAETEDENEAGKPPMKKAKTKASGAARK